MQRETSIVYVTLYHMMYFNPLPLCRGRHNHLVFLQQRFLISILSLYAEGDPRVICNVISIKKFQSSPSMQRETSSDPIKLLKNVISILSLYAEGDPFCGSCLFRPAYISILSLYAEGDHLTVSLRTFYIPFQSSPSMQRETAVLNLTAKVEHFNPLPLYRGRLQSCTIYYI